MNNVAVKLKTVSSNFVPSLTSFGSEVKTFLILLGSSSLSALDTASSRASTF